MRTYKLIEGEWYVDDRSLFKRVRRWLIWVGGLEKANGKGWDFERVSLSRKAYSDLVWWRLLLQMVTPVSVLGHRVTLQHFGVYVRWRSAYLCIHWLDSLYGKVRLRVYRSPDGTPHSAYYWIKGTPRDVIAADKKRRQKREQEERKHQAWLEQIRREAAAPNN